MTERKWTPGPWKFDVSGEWTHLIENENGDDVLCGCGCCGSPNLHRNDAYLIASAPDLYEALSTCLNFIGNTEDEMGETLMCGDKSRAALEKARGET